MQYRGRNRRLAGLAATALSAAVLAGPLLASPATSAPSDPEQLQSIRGQTAAAADDLGVRDAEADAAAVALDDVRGQVTAATAALDTARNQLQTARGDLVARQTELAVAQTAQRVAQEQVDTATATLGTARDQLRVMMRSALQNGVGGDLDVLMQSGTPDDLADRMGMLDHLSAARKTRIDALTVARTVVVEQERQRDVARQRSIDAVQAADDQVLRVSQLVDGARSAEQRLLGLQNARVVALSRAEATADAARARYEALQKASSDLTALLAARAQAQLIAARAKAVPVGPPRPVVGGRELIMPTAGVLTSVFGYRSDPFGRGRRFHAGQDLAAPTGTPILAATAGTIAYAGWANGYGNYTCVDRGSGFATCYGHQSQILVTVGQSVQQGQQIGMVGNTGNSTGPHLHFEVRLNGVPTDPMPYLA